MSNYAVVQITDNVVVNKIVADATSLAPDGTYLVLCDDVACNAGWVWDGNNFIDSNLPAEEII